MKKTIAVVAMALMASTSFAQSAFSGGGGYGGGGGGGGGGGVRVVLAGSHSEAK